MEVDGQPHAPAALTPRKGIESETDEGFIYADGGLRWHTFYVACI